MKAGRLPAAPTELLIVGAGPTGLALACLGRALGIRLRVIDRAFAPPP